MASLDIHIYIYIDIQIIPKIINWDCMMVVVVILLGNLCVGKNITLDLDTIAIVQGYQNKTKQNFSRTVNKIIKEWDEISLYLIKLRAEKKEKDILNAKVVKPNDSKNRSKIQNKKEAEPSA